MYFNKLTEYLDSLVNEGKAPGVDCIITKNHKRIYRHTYGYKDIKNNIHLVGDEKYMIFSMTKMITCVCALQLFEQGKFKLDDKLAEYLPEFSQMYVKCEKDENKYADCILNGTYSDIEKDGDLFKKKAENPITIRHLFSMGAGFNYDLFNPIIKSVSDLKGSNTQSIISAMSKMPLDFEPGTHFKYSLCIDVLGALIEVWSGQKFHTYFEENLAKPLGMKNSFFCKKDNSKIENLAKIYNLNDKNELDERPPENIFIVSDDFDSGGAGLISTTEDYSLFSDALCNNGVAANGNRILKKSSVDLMKTNQLNESQLKDFNEMRPGYGYGLGVRTHINPEISCSPSPIGEFGWDGAAGGFSLVDTENNISLTYFQHAFGWDIDIQKQMKIFLYESVKESK